MRLWMSSRITSFFMIGITPTLYVDVSDFIALYSDSTFYRHWRIQSIANRHNYSHSHTAQPQHSYSSIQIRIRSHQPPATSHSSIHSNSNSHKPPSSLTGCPILKPLSLIFDRNFTSLN